MPTDNITPLKRVRSAAEWVKTREQIAKAVKQVVRKDEDAKALRFLIDLVSNVHSEIYETAASRRREYSDHDKAMAADEVLKAAYNETQRHANGMLEWMGYEVAKPTQKQRRRA